MSDVVNSPSPSPYSPTEGARPAFERWRPAIAIAALLLLAVAPSFIYPMFLMKLMCFALFAASLNLLVAQAGLLSFGHAAFFGIGAYAAASLARFAGLDPLLCILLAMLAAACFGAFMGLLAIRRKGIYFAMITLAIAQLLYFIVHKIPASGGEDGLHEVPRGMLFGVIDLNVAHNIYAFILVLFALGMWFLWRIVNSPFGHIMQAIAAHEVRMTSLGYNIRGYKVAVFVMSAAIAGMAGAMNALTFQFATLHDLSFHLSGEAILMVLIGGVGTYFGPLVGAAVIVLLQSFLATSEFPAPVAVGLVFILCVLLFRRGVVGELVARLRP